MKKLGTINVVQERIATGRMRDAATKIYVLVGAEAKEALHVTDNKDMVAAADEVMGYYDIVHPSIMAGSWEEAIGDFIRVVERRLLKEGLAEANKYGILFRREQN